MGSLTTKRAKRLGRGKCLDTFSGYRHAECLAKTCDGADDLSALGTIHRQHERAVNFQMIEMELAQVIEARIAFAEIVERNADPRIL